MIKATQIKKTALVMVDLQNDFCPGGNLAVPEGDAVMSMANQLQPFFDIVIATKDWHPADHMSFAKNHPDRMVGDVMMVSGLEQVLWPVHCVQNTKGAEFHAELNKTRIQKIFFKGTDKTVDSYSAFFDNAHLHSTGLADYLLEQNVNSIYVLGLATDYCVKYTCLDAVHLGFDTYLIEDACRGVELHPQDIVKAIEEMHVAGVRVITSKEIF